MGDWVKSFPVHFRGDLGCLQLSRSGLCAFQYYSAKGIALRQPES